MNDLGSDSNASETASGVVQTIRSIGSLEIERLIEVYRPLLKATAAENFPDQLAGRLDQSDLVQEALLRGTSQIGQFSGSTDAEFGAWLKQILQNLIVDQVRRHTSEKRDVRRETVSNATVAAIDSSPSSVVGRQEELAHLAAAIRTLSDEQRQVTELRSQGQTFEEIGKQMGRSADAARMLWGRAVTRLLDLMQYANPTD